MAKRMMILRATSLVLALLILLLPQSSWLTERAKAFAPDAILLPDAISDHPAISNVDIIIDVGHGGIDGGTSYGHILEKNINLAIAEKTYEALRKKGYIVLINRSGDYALSNENLWLKTRSRHLKDLAQRSHLANEIKPKAMISLHVNSARRSSTRGAILLHQKNDQSKQLAKQLQQSLNALYGLHENPVYGKTYYLLKHTRVPTVIVEMGFITNLQDREMLVHAGSQQAIAESIAKGLQQYLMP
ncbi:MULTISPECIES: N-acetylmuramoyl-L-alanine amidase [unclassified Paenibacillus]|uniref:N-acetylmuramoyl-L-alanine amidase family protein n=1 Tax=unclassified Paenibacillus TaxID=185978 RepID=UPI001B6F688A|nr:MULTISPECIES: N-acetylmuramoyl-L-alanine amidase [unclassified Paenibacillus]MBP1156619.1 N-acetylmuramoyl-L-alanine amidase [Paenibacillus sp. PvP091]MBP1172643.1 N-acetylmuramoyl-L-alanine amidase [Paenibacillus sp. PvR098]MBP2439023.1 N-acetylmuramoyl-L-alanine amidase [Paenibacillus sp. PvP052]